MTGKEICKYLKELREAVAEAYNIEGFEYKECTFTGDCSGSCPACDAEAQLLYDKLKSIGKGYEVDVIKETESAMFPQDMTTSLDREMFPDMPPRIRTLSDRKIKFIVEGHIQSYKKPPYVRPSEESISGNSSAHKQIYMGRIMDEEELAAISKKDNPDKKLRGLFKKK